MLQGRRISDLMAFRDAQVNFNFAPFWTFEAHCLQNRQNPPSFFLSFSPPFHFFCHFTSLVSEESWGNMSTIRFVWFIHLCLQSAPFHRCYPRFLASNRPSRDPIFNSSWSLCPLCCWLAHGYLLKLCRLESTPSSHSTAWIQSIWMLILCVSRYDWI